MASLESDTVPAPLTKRPTLSRLEFQRRTPSDWKFLASSHGLASLRASPSERGGYSVLKYGGRCVSHVKPDFISPPLLC